MQGLLKTFLLVALTTLIPLGSGCSGKHKLVPGAPDWVNRGSGAFRDEGNAVFHGIGAVSGISSLPLAMQTADQRARADIARQLDTYVADLHRDYQDSTTAAGGRPPVEAQRVEESLKSVTQVSVHGARIIDHWRDPEGNTLYALARLDLAGVKAILEQAEGLSPGLKDHVRSRAERAFDEIRNEEKRRQ